MTQEEFEKLSPSQLVELALGDLEWVEQQRGMGVHIGNWIYSRNDIRYVCLAGATIYRSLGIKSPKEVLRVCGSDNRIGRMTTALDSIERKSLHGFLLHLNMEEEYSILNTEFYKIPYTPYEVDSVAFKQYLRDVVSLLRKNNL